MSSQDDVVLNTSDFDNLDEDIFFNDVEQIPHQQKQQRPVPKKTSTINSAAQKIAQQLTQPSTPPSANIRLKNEKINTVPQMINTSMQKIDTIPGPPIQAIQTKEDKKMDQYNAEKQKLYEHYEQLTKLAYSDKNGFIVRNFGMAQLVIVIGGDFVRLNGLIILRALKVKCQSRKQEKAADAVKSEAASYIEEVAGYLYEVWGEMENGQLGLTSSYIPSSVVSILDLKSGYDLPPED